ncbi:ribonucleoside triphosphate reductase [Candidatus Falkowbacteria bacterium RBG_13_39_14]|uniref:Ribonucleoside triphosphate reductase n=1 Tax=Candidatus Falkowbacteria bacterium RBG_13_39_14 TaxID=1797985 RepID=A0A1F5S113_9BACT|nr:MAG: ribonucleoside triphosphate reductase [Candidatus Falkowbacteria bacterium RBG_13_39_14]
MTYEKNSITQLRKRDGRIAEFDQKKIHDAISKAVEAVGEEKKADEIENLSDEVVKILNKKFHHRSIPAVEEIQDIVEEVLITNKWIKAAKAYILYRDQHAKLRNLESIVNSDELVDGYLEQLDWRVKENSNMAYSLQGLNNHISSAVSARYWLYKVYPEEIRNAHSEGDAHIHDLSILAPYCCGWELKELLLQGFGGVDGKIESSPPKHLRTALGQVVNFFYTLQGEVAGAQAFANFDTYLAPFIRYDNLDYKAVKQCMQEFLFNVNVPTRVGFQTPFTNITMDITPTKIVGEESVIMGGKPQKEKYNDFQREMDMINEAFCDIMMQGDSKGRVFTFPIPTYNITKNLDWASPVFDKVFEMTSKYGIPYFSNFINSNMDPDDARSMCCRLRLDNNELRKRGGGLFAANPLTGSVGVVAINLPRLGYLSKDKKIEKAKENFLLRLGKIMDTAKESLEIKRKILEKLTEEGLYPYAKHYLKSIRQRFGNYWRNHFSTIGTIGMNEALLNLMGKNIADSEGKKFALEAMDFMLKRIAEYQEETNNLYNLESVPGEGASYRLARIDKKKFPDIIVANEQRLKNGAEPYYTNSTHLPVNYTDDIFEALKLQDDLQTKYTGGTVLHGYIGEKMPSKEATKNLVKKIAENFHLPYFTITPTFSICPKHGYIPGEHFYCPICDEEMGYKESKNQ